MFLKEERAKQFMAFDALEGFYKHIKEKEAIKVPRKTLAEDRIFEIEEILEQISPGDTVYITYYSDYKYKKISGKISKIDSLKKILLINNFKINFRDIYKISVM